MNNKIITTICLIPEPLQLNAPHRALTNLANQIGRFNCSIQSHASIIKCDIQLSDTQKTVLNKIAREDNFIILYIEAYENNECINHNTISLL